MDNYFIHTFELSYRTTLEDILELTDHKLVKINGEYKSTKYVDRGLTIISRKCKKEGKDTKAKNISAKTVRTKANAQRICNFRMGYADGNFTSLKEHMLGLGYTIEQLLQSSLVTVSKNDEIIDFLITEQCSLL